MTISKLLRATLVLFALGLFACSVPEDHLWKNRIASEASLTGDTTYVEAIDLDFEPILDSLNADSLEHVAIRDFALFLPNAGSLGGLDSNDWIQDSILPRLRMQHIEQRMLKRFESQVFNQSLQQWVATDWRAKQDALLKSILSKAKQKFAGPNILDTLIPKALDFADTSVAKIPVAAFAVQNDGDYVWIVITKWAEKDSTYKHIEGSLFDARNQRLLGKFFCD